jgi:hypothetical protein
MNSRHVRRISSRGVVGERITLHLASRTFDRPPLKPHPVQVHGFGTVSSQQLLIAALQHQLGRQAMPDLDIDNGIAQPT